MVDYKIGICGVGFVGTAMMESFLNNGFALDKNLIIYDKYKDGGIGQFDSLLNTNILFISLPTPFNNSKKCYDISALNETMELLSEKEYSGTIIIKSTVEPKTSQNFASKYKLAIIHNPEFLTARVAFCDFHNQKHIVLGRTSYVNDDKLEIVLTFYKKYYPNAIISVCISDESESMKLFANCFYATKVQFFTELYLLCQKKDMNYNKIIDLMLKNGWINEMHTKVPGPDGNISFGGLCFPKDTKALLEFMKLSDVPCDVLDSVVSERDKMRDN